MTAPFINKNILWSQKANSNSSTFKNFGYFLYEFVGAWHTVLAFIGLFNVATFNLDYYSQILAGGIAVFLLYIISDAFSVFWNGYIGTNGMFKIFALLSMLMSCVYIFYKRGDVQFVDLSLFLFFLCL